MTNPKIDQKRLKWLPKDVKISESGDILYFVGCLPYFDVVFKESKAKTLKTAKSVVRILNKAGIEPVILKNERCCGHDLQFMGDRMNFEKLIRINVSAIKEVREAMTLLQRKMAKGVNLVAGVSSMMMGN